MTLSRGADSLPDTLFTLQDGNRGWGALTNTGRSVGTYPLVGDMNRDGHQDVFSCLSGTWQVYPGQADGLLAAAINSGVSCATNPEQSRVLDYNGDGRADLLYRSGANWYVLQSTGTGFTSVSTGVTTSVVQSPAVVDLDGDGLSDLVYQYADALYWVRNAGGALGSAQGIFQAGGTIYGYYEVPTGNPTVPMDVNGDGRADLVVYVQECQVNPNDPWQMYCQNVYYLLVSTGTGWSTFTAIYIQPPAEGLLLSNFRSGDVNGDGLDDLLYVQGSTWQLQLSQGTTLGAVIHTQIPATSPDKTMMVDYDGDGRDDLVRVDPGVSYAYLIHRSSGATLPTSYTDSLASTGASSATAFAADVSGDGFPEIVRVSGATWQTHKANGPLPDVVTTFTDGLGQGIDVAYESLSNTAQYTETFSTDPTGPYVQKYRGPRYVVTTEDRDDGIGGTHEFLHSYDSAWVDVSGRGWLSFNSHEVRDVRDGPDPDIKHRTVFGQTWPRTGFVDRYQLIRAYPYLVIKDVDPAINAYLYTPSTTPARYFVRIEQTTTKEYEMGGAYDGVLLRTIHEDPCVQRQLRLRRHDDHHADGSHHR